LKAFHTIYIAYRRAAKTANQQLLGAEPGLPDFIEEKRKSPDQR
jgi:hypothetical protein